MKPEEIIIGFENQTGLRIAEKPLVITTGKVIVNDIEITSVEDWEKVTQSLIELQQENQKLKSTREEIREYINTHRLFYCEPDEEELFEYVNDLRVKQDLLQIIDKGSDVK